MKLIKSYLIALVFIVAISELNAQTIQKSIKQLKTKKFNEAALYLISLDNGPTMNVEVLYCLSLFYAAPGNYQNKGKAAYYYHDLTRVYSETSLKEKKYLEKEYKINIELILKAGNTVAKAVYSQFSIEGDLYALREFNTIFPDYAISESKATKDWDIATEGEKLKLELGYNPELEKDYKAFIKKAGPKEIALVAIQVLASPKIQKKDWDGAILIFEKYKEKFPVQDYRIAKTIALLKEKADDVVIKSISDKINSSGDNYAPVLSVDEKTLYFCGRNRKDNLGNEDIFVSHLENNDWKKPELLKGMNKKRENEAPLCVTPNNNMLITYKNGDLWYSSKISADSWSEQKPLTSINTKEFVEIDASISSDGNVLFFASDREGNVGTFHHLGDPFNGGFMGNMDIWVSKKNADSTWGNPINIGKTINSNLCERSPFLHSDMKTLYFSSANYGSLGGLDVYKSIRLSDTSWTQWSEPVSMGKSINTALDDFDYKFTADGKKAIFTANKKESVYIAIVDLPETKKITNVKLLVNINDSTTGKALVADVIIRNLSDNKELLSQKSNNMGQIALTIAAEKQIDIYAECLGYHAASDRFDTYNIRDSSQITRNLKMSPVTTDFLLVDMDNIEKQPVTITLNNILFDYNLSVIKPASFPDLDRLVNFLKKYPDVFVIISGHTDNTGENEYNKNLSERRAISVKNYLVKNGFNENHFKSVGYGEERPVDTNETPEGRLHNRRVELLISAKGFAEE